MTHTEREWRDGQPEGTALDEGTGLDRPAAQAEPLHEGDPLAEPVHEGDPLAGHMHGDDPLVERAGEDDVLVERVGQDGPLVERSGQDEPLVKRARQDTPLVEEAHEPAGPASAGDQERFVARWQEIQAGFVDEPRRAVQDADALVVDMMDRLARMLASEREQLESLGEAGKVSTEDLRLGLRRYRALYERLLAV
jgi:hypothetical protein